MIHLGNLDQVAEIAYKGIRRAYVFMGLGVNASLNDSVSDFHIETDGIQCQSVELLSTEQLAEAKDSFRQWIIGNGFSELLHNYSIFMDKIYSMCMVVEIVRGNVEKAEGIKRERKFARSLSIGQKSKCLKEEFGISGILEEYIHGLNNARNALVHNNGIVSQSHCTNESALVVRWRRMAVGVIENGSDEFVPFRKNMLVEKGGAVVIKFEEAEKIFGCGSVVSLEPSDIHEICAITSFDVQKMAQTLAAYLKSMNVIFRDDKRVDDA